MKKLTKLKGIKSLTKNEQKAISGSGGYSCTQEGAHTCCQTYPSGFTFCDAGSCNQYPAGRCFWY